MTTHQTALYMKMKNMKMNGHMLSSSKQEAIQQYKRIKNHKTRLTRDHVTPKQNEYKKMSQEDFEKDYL
jgi:hypothetical protein